MLKPAGTSLMSGPEQDESYACVCLCVSMCAFWQPSNEMPVFSSISSLLDSMGR